MNPQAVNIHDRRLEHLSKSAQLLASSAPTVSAVLGSEEAELLLRKRLREQEKPRKTILKKIQERRREVCSACGCLMVPGWTSSFLIETRGRLHSQHSQGRNKIGKRMKKTGMKSPEIRKQESQEPGPAPKGDSLLFPVKYQPQTKNYFPKKVIYTCTRCNRRTIFNIPVFNRPKKRDRRKCDMLQVPSNKTDPQRLPKNFSEDSRTASRTDYKEKETDASKVNHATLSTDAQKKLSANASSKKRAKSRKQGALLAILNKKTNNDSLKTGLNLMDFMKPS